MSEVKDGTSRQTDPPYLEDVSLPHRRRTLRVALAVHERALITLITLKSTQVPIIPLVAPSLCYLCSPVMVSELRGAWSRSGEPEENNTSRPCFTT